MKGNYPTYAQDGLLHQFDVRQSAYGLNLVNLRNERARIPMTIYASMYNRRTFLDTIRQYNLKNTGVNNTLAGFSLQTRDSYFRNNV